MLARAISSVDLNPTDRLQSRRDKTGLQPLSHNPSPHSVRLPPLFTQAQAAAMAAGGSGGAAARPFAGACVHPRVSAPPSKGCAAVPLTPEPEVEPRGGVTCSVVASGSSRAPAMEMAGGEDGTAGPQVGSPFSTVPFLFLGLGFLFPIRFVRFGSSLSFDFFFSVLLRFHPIGD